MTKLPQGQGDDERLANDTNRGDYGGNFGRVEGGRVMILSLERSPWQKSKLGELVNDLTKSRWISVSGDDDVIDPTIKSATHTISVGQITPAVSVKITKRLEILPGDLVFSRLHTQNGAFAYSTVRFTATSTFIPLQVKEGIVDKRFLFWALHIWIPTLSTSDSVGRETYKTEDILSLEIPLPSLSEQQRIVARLEALARRVEEARGLRRAAVEEVEALLKSTMRGVFKSTAEIQNVSLENVCAAIIDNLHSNPVYSEDGTVPCIRSSDVGWGKLFLNTAQKTNETEYRKRTVRAEPIEDDVVLVREGGGTGKAAIVGREQRFSLGQRVMMLRPNKIIVHPKYLLYQLLSPNVYEDQIIPLSKGSASPHLNIGALRKFNFVLPSLADQRRIVAYLDGLQAKVDELRRLQAATQKELDALMPSILAKAFAGEL